MRGEAAAKVMDEEGPIRWSRLRGLFMPHKDLGSPGLPGDLFFGGDTKLSQC